SGRVNQRMGAECAGDDPGLASSRAPDPREPLRWHYRRFWWQSVREPDKPMRMKLRAVLVFAAVGVLTTPAFAQLTARDVNKIIKNAVTRSARISPNSVIAVTDREGNVLAVWVVRGGAATLPEIATAVSKAGTAAYLSSNQNAFTSRTAGFIIQQHFPPGVI